MRYALPPCDRLLSLKEVARALHYGESVVRALSRVDDSLRAIKEEGRDPYWPESAIVAYIHTRAREEVAPEERERALLYLERVRPELVSWSESRAKPARAGGRA